MKDTLLTDETMELIAKLEQLTSRPNARQLRRQGYVMARVRTHNEKLYYAIDGLNTAINDDRKVTFRYFDWTPDGGKAYRRSGTPYETTPVALCEDKHYYLVAYDPAIQDYRHYRVDRMECLTVTDTHRGPLPELFGLARIRAAALAGQYAAQFDAGWLMHNHFDQPFDSGNTKK